MAAAAAAAVEVSLNMPCRVDNLYAVVVFTFIVLSEGQSGQREREM